MNETSRRVESFDADLFNKLKISSLFNYMQDSAAAHAEELGVGYQALLDNNIFWVLSWAKLEISKLPSYGEKVKIKTWNKGKKRFFYMRDFIFFNEKGEELLRATTAWLLLNSNTKKITDLGPLGWEIPPDSEEHAIEEYPGKFRFNTEGRREYLREIFYSDIDLNKHVNNARYIEFILNCYNQDEHNEKKISSLTIRYNGESHFMDELIINRSSLIENETHHHIRAVRKEDSREVFNALLEWQ